MSELDVARQPVVKLPTSKRNIVFVLVTLSYFMVWFDENTFSVTTPFWSVTYNLDTAQIASIASAYLLGYFPLLFVAGMIADKIGARMTLLISVLACGILSLCMLWTTSENTMFLRNVVFGIFFGFNFAPCNKLITIWTNTRERTLKASLWNAFGSASGIVAGPFGLLIAAWAEWQYAFIIICIISVILFIFMLVFLKNKPEDYKTMSQEERDFVNEKSAEEIEAEAKANKAVSVREMLGALKSGHTWAMAIVIGVCIGPTYMGMWGSMYLINGQGWSAEYSSLMIPIYSLTTFAGIALIPVMQRLFKGSIRKLVSAAVIIGGLSYVCGGTLDLPPVLAGFLCLGLAYIVNPWGWGSFNAYWAKTHKPEFLGTVNGLGAAMCTLVGYILMKTSGSLITDEAGPVAYSKVWLVAGIIMLSTLIPMIGVKKVSVAYGKAAKANAQ
jgi:sugar phosphate permease